MLPPDQDRRARRALWPVQLRTLREQGSDDVFACLTPAERIVAVAQLTTEAWALTGRSVPAYTRAETPIAIRALRAANATDG
jgi:hypothetical protein